MDTDGEVNGTSVPGQVALSEPVSQLALTCDTVLALGFSGQVYAWGANQNGQLGSGTMGSAITSVPAAVDGLTDVLSIAAGTYSYTSQGRTTRYSHALAVKADGTVWAWGSNLGYQLGVANTADTASLSTPAQVGVTKTITEMDRSRATVRTGA